MSLRPVLGLVDAGLAGSSLALSDVILSKATCPDEPAVFKWNLHREVAAGCEHCFIDQSGCESQGNPLKETLLPDGAFITTPRETL